MRARRGAREVLRCCLALLFVLWLGWSTLAAGRRLGAPLVQQRAVWRDAFEPSLEERRRRTLDERDREAGRPRGFVSGIVDAVLAHVPEHGTVHAAGLETRKEAQALVPLPHLCFPRRLALAPRGLPEDWELLEGSYLLTFDAELDARLAGRKRVLATGAGWTLWH